MRLDDIEAGMAARDYHVVWYEGESRLDEVEVELARLRSSPKLNDRVLALACPTCERDCQQARQAVTDLETAHDGAAARIQELKQILADIVARSAVAVHDQDGAMLDSCRREWDAITSRAGNARTSWNVVAAVLASQDTPKSNQASLRHLREGLRKELPQPLLGEVLALEDALGRQAAAAAVTAERARQKAARRDYAKAAILAKDAATADRESWGAYAEVLTFIYEALAGAKVGNWVLATSTLLRARQHAPADEMVARELLELWTTAIRALSVSAADARLEPRERALAIRQMDAIAAAVGRKASTRSLEKALVDSFPRTKVRFDLVRASNDRNSVLFTKVQAVLEAVASEYGEEVASVDALEQAVAYSGGASRPRPFGGDVFVVAVDVVNFATEVHRDQETMTKEYVSRYETYQVPNPEHDKWERDVRECDNMDTSYDNDWEKALVYTALAACTARRINEPPRELDRQRPVYDDCSYRITDYARFGIAEVRVELLHVPNAVTYLDETFRGKIDDHLQKVEYRSGDCEKAGVRLKTLAKEPSEHDMVEPLLADISRQAELSLRRALRPTELGRWLTAQSAREGEAISDGAVLGAVYEEGGLGGVMRHLGVADMTFDGLTTDVPMGIYFDSSAATPRITSVQPGSAGELSGLRAGDVVLSIDGLDVGRAVRRAKDGAEHPVHYVRVIPHGSRAPVDRVVEVAIPQ
jgi:hypothetical protein